MRFQHGRKYDTVKYDIILPYEMHQFGVFTAPVISPPLSQFLRGADIADRRIEPNIQHFAICIR